MTIGTGDSRVVLHGLHEAAAHFEDGGISETVGHLWVAIPALLDFCAVEAEQNPNEDVRAECVEAASGLRQLCREYAD